MAATKGSSGSRRWIRRKPIDTRPIAGMLERDSWLDWIEPFATAGCGICFAVVVAIGLYVYLADFAAGHL